MRPLLFVYDHHGQASAKKLVQEQFQLLQALKYKVVCFEYPSCLNLEEALEFSHRALIQSRKQMQGLTPVDNQSLSQEAFNNHLKTTVNHKRCLYNFTFLVELHKRKSFHYVGIDHARNHPLNDLSLEQRSSTNSMSIRNAIMVNNLLRAKSIFGNNLVVIIGLKHYPVQQQLQLQKIETVGICPLTIANEGLNFWLSEMLESIKRSNGLIQPISPDDDCSDYLINALPNNQKESERPLIESVSSSLVARQISNYQTFFNRSTSKEQNTLLKQIMREWQLAKQYIEGYPSNEEAEESHFIL